MELSTFIKTTLVEIQTGVHQAIQETKNGGITGAINPVWGGIREISANEIQKVRFDVAVTVSEKASGSVDGGIKVMKVGIGAKDEQTDEKSHVSRIQFEIPIIPPVTTVNN